MAVYHLNVKVVKRSSGKSAVAAAAYRARAEMHDERTGETWNYSRNRKDVLFSGVFTPKNAPQWMQDPAALWNAAEKAERYKNAQVARDFTLALPHELDLKQQQWAVQNFVKDNFTSKGYVAHVAIHRPGREGDNRNVHAHILVTMRTVDGMEFAAKKDRKENDRSVLQGWRESWTTIGNAMLIRAGHAPTLDNRSYERQGIEKVPTIHLGPDASSMERNGIATDRGDQLIDIQQQNTARAIVAELKPYAMNSAVDRLWKEEQAAAIADQLDKTTRLNGRGAGVPHYVRELLSAFGQLTRTMGAAIADVVRMPPPRQPLIPSHETVKERAAATEAQRPTGQRQAPAQPRGEHGPIERLRETLRDTALPPKEEPTEQRGVARSFLDRLNLSRAKSTTKNTPEGLHKDQPRGREPEGPER